MRFTKCCRAALRVLGFRSTRARHRSQGAAHSEASTHIKWVNVRASSHRLRADTPSPLSFTAACRPPAFSWSGRLREPRHSFSAHQSHDARPPRSQRDAASSGSQDRKARLHRRTQHARRRRRGRVRRRGPRRAPARRPRPPFPRRETRCGSEDQGRCDQGRVLRGRRLEWRPSRPSVHSVRRDGQPRLHGLREVRRPGRGAQRRVPQDRRRSRARGSRLRPHHLPGGTRDRRLCHRFRHEL